MSAVVFSKRLTVDEREAWRTSRIVSQIFREAQKQGDGLRALLKKSPGKKAGP